MNAKLITGVGLAVALSACVTVPQPNAELENARAAVQTAEADPNVNKYAPLDLDRAKQDLSAAEDAALHHRTSEIAQPAYLATQNARIAQAHDTAIAVSFGDGRDRGVKIALAGGGDNAAVFGGNAGFRGGGLGGGGFFGGFRWHSRNFNWQLLFRNRPVVCRSGHH